MPGHGSSIVPGPSVSGESDRGVLLAAYLESVAHFARTITRPRRPIKSTSLLEIADGRAGGRSCGGVSCAGSRKSKSKCTTGQDFADFGASDAQRDVQYRFLVGQ